MTFRSHLPRARFLLDVVTRASSQRTWSSWANPSTSRQHTSNARRQERTATKVSSIDDLTRPSELLYFITHSLPCGAVGVRLSRDGSSADDAGSLPVNCYDDFPTIIPDNLKVIVDVAVKSLEMVAGWKWKGGEKDLDFAAKFNTLGVLSSLSEVSTDGLLRIEKNHQNCPGRSRDNQQRQQWICPDATKSIQDGEA